LPSLVSFFISIGLFSTVKEEGFAILLKASGCPTEIVETTGVKFFFSFSSFYSDFLATRTTDSIFFGSYLAWIDPTIGVDPCTGAGLDSSKVFPTVMVAGLITEA
jgi:hypothetical protein